jgi:hypothetical protein
MLFIPYAPGDEIAGDWSREQLVDLDSRFCEALALAECPLLGRSGHGAKAAGGAFERSQTGLGCSFSS